MLARPFPIGASSDIVAVQPHSAEANGHGLPAICQSKLPAINPPGQERKYVTNGSVARVKKHLCQTLALVVCERGDEFIIRCVRRRLEKIPLFPTWYDGP